MRDLVSKGLDLGSEGWNLGSQPQDQGSQAVGSESSIFEDIGIRLFHFYGTRDHNVSRFWNQGSQIWVQKWVQRLKNVPRYDLASRLNHITVIVLLVFSNHD